MSTNPLPATAPGGAIPQNDIRAIKPPLVIPDGWLWFWIVLAVIIVGLICYLLWRKNQKKEIAKPVIPPTPPHIKARQRLEEALLLIGQPQPFCFAVSGAIRNYLEERFDFRAPERTTEEFLHELSSTNLLLPDQKQSLGEFLSSCDMVKFARYEPGPAELKSLHGSATRLIDETEPAPQPAAANSPTAS